MINLLFFLFSHLWSTNVNRCTLDKCCGCIRDVGLPWSCSSLSPYLVLGKSQSLHVCRIVVTVWSIHSCRNIVDGGFGGITGGWVPKGEDVVAMLGVEPGGVWWEILAVIRWVGYTMESGEDLATSLPRRPHLP